MMSFAATGITDGELLKGVRFVPNGITSNSIVMRSRSQTIRLIESEHPAERKLIMEISVFMMR